MKKILKHSILWHRWLTWTGGAALIIFVLSGLTHPIMTWTGPKAAAFFPPKATMKSEHVAAIPRILKYHDIKKAIMVKVVPSQQGTVLQITEQNDAPRRYFDLSSGKELKNYDVEQAIWLARHYTGLQDAAVKDMTFQKTFNHAYPWVNRLLPVYRISFDTDDNRVAFIYTELGVLANLTNDWKTSLQTIFRIFHTWSWFDDFEHAKVLWMMILLLSLLIMIVTGMAMVCLMKNRKMEKKRRFHRYIAYGIWLPLLMFSSSGIYHLLQYTYGDNHRGLKLADPITVTADRFGEGTTACLEDLQQANLNNISIVEGPNNHLLYRLSMPTDRSPTDITKQQYFDGLPIEGSALYCYTKTGQLATLFDRKMAIYYANKQLNLKNNDISQVTLITRFNSHYDFRNKRLPVWQIDYETEHGDKIFIDPATGMLVDRLVNRERYEGYSFSFLHKWNFLVPLIGRMARDLLIVSILLIAIVTTILGYKMRLKRHIK